MKISVHNRQTKRRPNVPKLAALARFFMRQAARRQSGRSWNEVIVALTDDAGISAVNRTFLDRPGATDVIAFTLAAVPGAGAGHNAEIYLNLERALEEGARRINAAHELALYLAHACDHLAGANDHAPAERRRMRRRELLWLEQARQAGLMKGLWAKQSLPWTTQGRGGVRCSVFGGA